MDKCPIQWAVVTVIRPVALCLRLFILKIVTMYISSSVISFSDKSSMPVQLGKRLTLREKTTDLDHMAGQPRPQGLCNI